MDDPSTPGDGDRTAHRPELAKEGSTMALYIAVSLLAVLAALADADHGNTNLTALIWGTTIGLALAHLFAFRVSARLVAQGSVTEADAAISGVQMLAAAFVGALAWLPVVILGPTAELDASRLLLSLFIAAMGYLVAISGGATRTRAIIYGVAILALAATVAVVKNILGGH